MTNYQKQLSALVDDFLNGRMNLADLQSAYSSCFADENADLRFSQEAADYQGEIHEKAEFTASAPTAEERRFGWLDETGFDSGLKRT